MNKHLFLAILMLVSISVQAQTARSGINNPTPTVTLDVTGNPTNTNFFDGVMAPRLTGVQLRAKTYTATQNGAIVNVTVADPAPAGQTINVTTPGYYYFNGSALSWIRFVGGAGGVATTGQILTADVNGFGVWKTLAVTSIPGTLPASGSSVSFSSYGSGTPPNTILYTTGYITLPPGKWLVAFGTTAGIGYNATYPRMLNTDANLWLTLYLSDSNTTGANTADYITTYSGPRGSAGVLGRGANKTYVSGYEAVNNTSGANKIYYLWAYQEQDINPGVVASSTTRYDNGSGTEVNAYWLNIMDVSYWERYFFAIPIQ